MAERDWLRESLEAYRRGRAKLDLHKNDPRPEVQFLVDDLKEALLDLKQATIANDEFVAAEHMTEISFFIAQLDALALED